MRDRLSGVLVWYSKGFGKNDGRKLRFGEKILGILSLGGTSLSNLVLGRGVWLWLVRMGEGELEVAEIGRREDAFPYARTEDDRVRSGRCMHLRWRRRWRGNGCGVM
jgi:hypothetical protein